ncbi:MAG: DUF4019 domain-containing protein [Victivallales bacterium]|nr:DUF4019 domain-containing protein [Victivallales bacterium]
MMKKVLFALLLLPLICSASNPETEKAAVAAAENWLALIDAAQYAASWQQAAQYFKNALPEDRWLQTVKAVRKPLGAKLSRQLISKRYCTSLPGAPDGEYVVIQFKSSFKNKSTAIETVTPMRAEDGKWRVAGYFIK